MGNINELRKVIRQIINEDFHPGDTQFIMSIAHKKGIKKFDSPEHVVRFINHWIIPFYNITNTYESDVQYIFENYENYVAKVEQQRDLTDTMKTFSKELPFDEDEIEPYL